METTKTEDKHYLKGFEDGCNFICLELQRWGKEHDIYVSDILHHLKGVINENQIRNNQSGDKDWVQI